MTTPTLLPQPMPSFGSEQFQSEVNTPSDQPVDDILGRLDILPGSAVSSSAPPLRDQAIEIVHKRKDDMESSVDLSGDFYSNSPVEAGAGTESEFEADPELVSHFSTTVSSLRLRHQEQLHLQSLFTSKLEALAQKSLEHEASIQSLTAQLQSLRESNTQLGRENATLACANKDLRIKMQGMMEELLERETAVEAMTGAVRGLEGWIESASISPRSDAQVHLLQDQAVYRRGARGAIRGRGRFRGRRYVNHDETRGFGLDGSTDRETMEIQEGVMAWVRGFRDVEESLKERHGINGIQSGASLENGRPPGDQTIETTHSFDEDFGDFETGG